MMDFKTYLPRNTYYKFKTPILQQYGDYLAFHVGKGVLNRKDIVSWFHSIEHLKKALKRANFEVEIKGEEE